MITEAYELGREAAFEWLNTTAGERSTRQRLCPFARGTAAQRQFCEGWDDAIEEAR